MSSHLCQDTNMGPMAPAPKVASDVVLRNIVSMERHRAEVDRIEQANSDALKRQHADITAQHEAHIRQLRDRMAQEHADAVERERSMGAAKAREACERAEQQMQLGRMRLQAEADLRLERAEQSKREERDRHASALAAAKEEHAAALAAATAASNERMETAWCCKLRCFLPNYLVQLTVQGTLHAVHAGGQETHRGSWRLMMGRTM